MSVTVPYNRREYRRNRRAVIAAAGGRCQVQLPGCTGLATTADHIRSIDAGGGNGLDNLRAACKACNSRLGVEITNAKRRDRTLGSRSRDW
jgi:5-methylcytosine-specific restriction endonuclease McrA